MAHIVRSNLTTRPVGSSSRKTPREANKNLAEQSLVLQQYVVLRDVRVSDRCVGLRIQPRCANAAAAPLRSQTTARCRSMWTRTSRPTRPAHPAFVCRGYLLFESTHTAAAVAAAAAARSSCWARILGWGKKRADASARLFTARLLQSPSAQAWMLESRAE